MASSNTNNNGPLLLQYDMHFFKAAKLTFSQQVTTLKHLPKTAKYLWKRTGPLLFVFDEAIFKHKIHNFGFFQAKTSDYVL